MDKFSADNHGPDDPVVDMEKGRRAFLRSVGLGTASAAVAGVAGIAPAMAAGGVSDLDVLTFALNLEYLEAEFYLRAYTGHGLPSKYIGNNPGQVTGGKKVPFSDSLVAAYAEEIAQDEENHVIFLRSAIRAAGGPGPVSRPAIDLDTSFTTAARAAGVIGPSDQFDAFANDTNFLLAAYIFEDVGVSAYHGAAQFLIDNTTYLNAAAGILAVEAYHAGLIRTVLFAMGQSSATRKISHLRQTLGPVKSSVGAGASDAGVGTPMAPNIVLTDNVSIAPMRDTRAVLNVVYGAMDASKGLFFPNGLNGPIK